VGISYSGGTSSEWLIEAVIQGVIPRPEPLCVFCADTGEEHDWTYQAMDEVEVRCKAAGIKFVRCARPGDSLGDHLLRAVREGRTRADHPPFWVDKGGSRGKIQQRCTKEFKTAVLRRAAARWVKSLGRRKQIVTWIGFAADEANRAQKSLTKVDVKWERREFPAIRLGKTRADQRRELIEWTGRAPAFSMCVCCPFKSPARWRATTGDNLARAIQIDDAIRDLDQFGLTDGATYLSDRLVPVADLIRSSPTAQETEELATSCDAGACFL
jgi:hypothetical protein